MEGGGSHFIILGKSNGKLLSRYPKTNTNLAIPTPPCQGGRLSCCSTQCKGVSSKNSLHPSGDVEAEVYTFKHTTGQVLGAILPLLCNGAQWLSPLAVLSRAALIAHAHGRANILKTNNKFFHLDDSFILSSHYPSYVHHSGQARFFLSGVAGPSLRYFGSSVTRQCGQCQAVKPFNPASLHHHCKVVVGLINHTSGAVRCASAASVKL